MFNKILLAGVAVLSAVSMAHATDRLPKDVLGKWCSNSNSDLGNSKWETAYYDWNKDCDPTAAIEIKQNEWIGWEDGCRFTEVKTRFDPTIPLSTKSGGVWVAHIKAKCSGEGCDWHSNFVLYFSKGRLVMRGRNSRNSCHIEPYVPEASSPIVSPADLPLMGK
jgi:hypothetical protein